MKNENRMIVWLYYGLVLLLLFPVVSLSYIVTHDGPSHVYNAGLIEKIITGNEFLSEFLNLKSFPDPNWTGHFILLFLQWIFEPGLSEKIFLAAYIVFFPLLFRRLLITVNAENHVLSFLALPFLYSNFFFLGVYNFLIGNVLLFLALKVTLPGLNERNFKNHVWILVFSLLLYFSHLIALGIYLIIIFISVLFIHTAKQESNNAFGFRRAIAFLFKLLIPLAPAVVLLIVFFSEKAAIHTKPAEVSLIQMTEFLFYIAPTVTLTRHPEIIYAAVIFFTFVFLLIYALVSASSSGKRTRERGEYYQRPSFWGIISGIMLLFYFFIPDSAATGSVIKFRFEYFFFLFLILFLATSAFNRTVRIVLMLVIIPWIVLKFLHLYPMMRNLSADAELITTLKNKMRDNSILLPLNYSDNWMHHNISGYATAGTGILNLDNYEAGSAHFPLQWKHEKNPNVLLGNFNGYPPLCADVLNYEKVVNHPVDYISLWHDQSLTDSCSVSIKNIISQNYRLIYDAEDRLKLFERK